MFNLYDRKFLTEQTCSGKIFVYSLLLILLFIFVGILQANNGILRKYWTHKIHYVPEVCE